MIILKKRSISGSDSSKYITKALDIRRNKLFIFRFTFWLHLEISLKIFKPEMKISRVKSPACISGFRMMMLILSSTMREENFHLYHYQSIHRILDILALLPRQRLTYDLSRFLYIQVYLNFSIKPSNALLLMMARKKINNTIMRSIVKDLVPTIKK